MRLTDAPFMDLCPHLSGDPQLLGFRIPVAQVFNLAVREPILPTARFVNAWETRDFMLYNFDGIEKIGKQ
jgi:hypothetical protein